MAGPPSQTSPGSGLAPDASPVQTFFLPLNVRSVLVFGLGQGHQAIGPGVGFL